MPAAAFCVLSRRGLLQHERERCVVCVFPGPKGSQSLDWRLAVPTNISEDHPVCIREGATARRHHNLRGWSLRPVPYPSLFCQESSLGLFVPGYLPLWVFSLSLSLFLSLSFSALPFSVGMHVREEAGVLTGSFLVTGH